MTGGMGSPASRITEVGLGEPEGFLGLHVAGNRERRVRRPVIGPEELAHLVDPRSGNVLRRADREPVIWMIRRIERGNDRHPGKTVRPVLVLLTPFVEHDVALILELASVSAGSR
jgi:hypothetical protein